MTALPAWLRPYRVVPLTPLSRKTSDILSDVDQQVGRLKALREHAQTVIERVTDDDGE